MEHFELKAEQGRYGWWCTAYRMVWDGSQFVKEGDWMRSGPCDSERQARALARNDIAATYPGVDWCAW